MAATELLEADDTAATSAEFSVADGESGTVFLKNGSGGAVPSRARVLVKVKDSNGDFNEIGVLTATFRAGELPPGSYVVTRVATGDSVGVEGIGVTLA